MLYFDVHLWNEERRYLLIVYCEQSKIWLAAHWDAKLTKAQVVQTDIEESVGTLCCYSIPTVISFDFFSSPKGNTENNSN